MAYAPADTASAMRRTTARPIPQYWLVIGCAVLAALAMALPNLADPMLRYDDFPALLADPAGFWAKTLHEGRWVNYLWHLRGAVTPVWLNFAAYQVLWAVFAASLAVSATRGEKSIWFAIVLALLILVTPSATLISLWFNTLLPGLGLVALYAALAHVVSRSTLRTLMPAFVILTFMAYTTYPILILAICLIRTTDHSLRDLFGVLYLFVVSFAVAVLTVYTINYMVHGNFGVPLADWREAAPAGDMAGMIGNLPLVAASFSDLMDKSSFGFAPAIWFHLAMLVGGTAVLISHAPREVLYLHAGLWMGLALVVVQILKLGVIVPPRTYIFVWVFYAVVIVRAAQCLSAHPGLPGRIARNFVLLIAASYLLQTFQQYRTYREWQADTRALARIVAANDGTVIFEGDVLNLPSARAAGVQNALALQFRMQQLTGKAVMLCQDAVECAALRAADARTPSATVQFVSDASGTRLVFPD
jgi:hypothetical protein